MQLALWHVKTIIPNNYNNKILKSNNACNLAFAGILNPGGSPMMTNNTGIEKQTESPAQKPVLVFYYSDDSIFKESPASNYDTKKTTHGHPIGNKTTYTKTMTLAIAEGKIC